MHPYPELSGFEAAYLEDSFVLSISAQPRLVVLVIDLVLTADHDEYRPPKPGEQYCYRKAEIVFDSVEAVWWKMYTIRPAIDASGEKDYGGIDDFRFLGDHYLLDGDFGQLNIEAASCRLSLGTD